MATKALLFRDAIVFFAWGFVMHTTGLLLHEFGGHALAAVLFGCGIDGFRLTFFGHGQVHYAPCARWTETTVLLADWAGLALTISAGIGAALCLLRRGFSPMTRLLVALVASTFLVGQLGYATAGGFHDLYDPRNLALLLGARNVHVIAWLPAVLAYAVSALLCARAVVEAFREHYGCPSRLDTLVEFVATLGVSGALYYAAFRIEWQLRVDMPMRGVAAEAERIAVTENAPPPFPIELVLTGIAAFAVVAALARPVRTPREPSVPPRRVVAFLWAATAGCFVVLAVLVRR